MVTRLAVLGASGFIGRALVTGFARDGHEVVAVGRDPRRLDGLVPDLPGVGREVLDITDRTRVRSLAEDVEMVVSAVGPPDQRLRVALAAALASGTAYLDATADPHLVAWARREWDERSRATGVTAVPGAGVAGVVGDVLAEMAVGAVTEPVAVHVAYAVPDPSTRLKGWSRGSRRAMALQAGAPVLARVGGQQVEERLGEERRLAWFPRPVGPRHAAAIPGTQAVTVPPRHPGVDTVRTYVAVGTALAELLQAAGNAARSGTGRTLVTRLLERAPDPPPQRRQGMRWACVAEARGSDGIGRAWAYGHDPQQVGIEALCLLVRRLPRAPAGVLGPADVATPAEMLDGLAASTDLRWSVSRP